MPTALKLLPPAPIEGTGADEAIRGGLGNDIVYGGLDDDDLHGDNGGGRGSDILIGSADNDTLTEGATARVYFPLARMTAPILSLIL